MIRYLLCNSSPSENLSIMVDELKECGEYHLIHSFDDVSLSIGDLIVFAVDLNWMGDDPFITRVINDSFENYDFTGIRGAVLVASKTEYYTKRYAQHLIFVLNQRGLKFKGHSFVEAIGAFENFNTWQKNYELSLVDVCRERIKELHHRLIEKDTKKRSRVLVLHASHQETSNTLMLWQMVHQHLPDFEIKIMHIENGNIVDCKGCDFTTCLHYSKSNSCFYGGQVTKEILPAVEWAEIVVWICPNYNDAVSAMHSALINRLTVLYRRISFYDKQTYGLIVSGNSGSDSVACQLIGGLNINKGFELPPNAFITAIANDPGSIRDVIAIEKKAKDFAQMMISNA